MRRNALIPLLVLAVLAWWPTSAPAQFLFGVSAFTPVQSAGLTTLPGAGITLFRASDDWSKAQPVADAASIDWSAQDQTVTTLATSGLTWLPMLHNTPAWARTNPADPGSAPDPAAFTSFAVALVSRYGPNGSFWKARRWLTPHPLVAVEVLNETNYPDGTHPRGQIDPGTFFDLYSRTLQAVHAIAPSVRVISGGLLDAYFANPVTYLQTMVRERPGSLAHIQELGWHPYLASQDEILSHLQALRSFLDANGAANVPIATTELDENRDLFTADDWAGLINQLAVGLPNSSCRVSMLIPFLWQLSDRPPGTDNMDGWWTLSYPDGSLTVPGEAFLRATQTQASAQPNGWCGQNAQTARAVKPTRPTHRGTPRPTSKKRHPKRTHKPGRRRAGPHGARRHRAGRHRAGRRHVQRSSHVARRPRHENRRG